MLVVTKTPHSMRLNVLCNLVDKWFCFPFERRSRAATEPTGYYQTCQKTAHYGYEAFGCCREA